MEIQPESMHRRIPFAIDSAFEAGRYEEAYSKYGGKSIKT